MKRQPIPNPITDRSVWEALCPTNSYKIISPQDFPEGVISTDLLGKCDSILLVSSGNATSTAYYMANINRVESKTGEIDQQPFGLLLVGASASSSGLMFHHGNWCGRTSQPPPEFWENVKNSGIGKCYPLKTLPSKNEGPIEELDIDCQHVAFGKLIDDFKKQSK
jgi:hypothetical protein